MTSKDTSREAKEEPKKEEKEERELGKRNKPLALSILKRLKAVKKESHGSK